MRTIRLAVAGGILAGAAALATPASAACTYTVTQSPLPYHTVAVCIEKGFPFVINLNGDVCPHGVTTSSVWIDGVKYAVWRCVGV